MNRTALEKIHIPLLIITTSDDYFESNLSKVLTFSGNQFIPWDLKSVCTELECTYKVITEKVLLQERSVQRQSGQPVFRGASWKLDGGRRHILFHSTHNIYEQSIICPYLACISISHNQML